MKVPENSTEIQTENPDPTIADRLKPAIRIAKGLVGKIGWLSVLAVASGLWLWLVLFFPFAGLNTVWKAALLVVALFAIVLPGGITALMWLGLRELIQLPERLLGHADTGNKQTRAMIKATLDKETRQKTSMRHFYGAATGLRDSLLASKGLLMQAAAAARLINPFFLVTCTLAAAISVVIITAAAVIALVVIL